MLVRLLLLVGRGRRRGPGLLNLLRVVDGGVLDEDARDVLGLLDAVRVVTVTAVTIVLADPDVFASGRGIQGSTCNGIVRVEKG